MTLDQLAENDSGIIEKIHDNDLSDQLLRMGITIGETVKVEKIAPLKDPIVITAAANYLSLRKTDAKNIQVKQPN